MKKKIIIVISILFVIAVMALVLISMKTSEPVVNYTEDEISFKDEYEKLNGINYKDDVSYKTVSINSDNNIKYVTDEEILDLLKNGTNIIYFGWPECNWCRSIVSPLIEVVKENDIDTLYYYNFKDLRAAYENNSDKSKVKLYEDILDIIGEDIDSIFDEGSERAGKKKILAPTVIFVKNNKYIGLHVKSVESQLNSSDELTKEQIKELKDIYKKYVTQIKLEVCYDEGC